MREGNKTTIKVTKLQHQYLIKVFLVGHGKYIQDRHILLLNVTEYHYFFCEISGRPLELRLPK